MVDEGSLLESLPDGPVPTSVLADLKEHDGVDAALPLTARPSGDQEVADRAILQTASVAVVVSYDDDGWVVDHRIDAEGRDPGDVLSEALSVAQDEQEAILDAMEQKATDQSEIEIDPEDS